MTVAMTQQAQTQERATVWLDGEILPGSEARVPVFDHGLLYGDGVFEAMRIIGRRVFRLPDHLARLAAGSKAIGIQLPGGISGLEKIVLETARAHGEDDAYVRLIVTRGDGDFGVDPRSCLQPRVICIVGHIRLYPPEKLARGIELATVSTRRPAADSLDPRVKSLNYLSNVMSRREATLYGADEALVLNDAGLVAEASVANVFAVKGGELFTPPATQGALEGITRACLLEIAASLGIVCHEKPLGRFDLFAADEVFLSGTAARVVPVATLDGQPIGSEDKDPGAGPMTMRLSAALAASAQEQGVPF